MVLPVLGCATINPRCPFDGSEQVDDTVDSRLVCETGLNFQKGTMGQVIEGHAARTSFGALAVDRFNLQ